MRYGPTSHRPIGTSACYACHDLLDFFGRYVRYFSDVVVLLPLWPCTQCVVMSQRIYSTVLAGANRFLLPNPPSHSIASSGFIRLSFQLTTDTYTIRCDTCNRARPLVHTRVRVLLLISFTVSRSVRCTLLVLLFYLSDLRRQYLGSLPPVTE